MIQIGSGAMELSTQTTIRNHSTPAPTARGCAPACGLPIVGSSASSPVEPRLSSLAAFSIQNQLTELSVSNHKTDLVFRKDNSLLLKASSQFDLTLRQESTRIDLTLTADRLGLTPADFAALGGKPIEIRFSISQMDAQIEFRSETNVIKKNRTLDEILRDLTSALTDILKNRGDKSIAVLMDEEALAILSGDPKVSGLMDELFALIQIINNLKMQEGERDRYAIILSGKGKPYIEHQESTRVNIENRIQEFNMTILPPAQAQSSVEGSSEPVAEEQEVTP